MARWGKQLYHEGLGVARDPDFWTAPRFTLVGASSHPKGEGCSIGSFCSVATPAAYRPRLG